MIRVFWILCLAIFPLLNVSCDKSHSAAHNAVAEKYVPYSGSVPFDIVPLSGKSSQWLATYAAQGKTAKFRIDLGTSVVSDYEEAKELGLRFGKGTFIAEPGSDASVLLSELKRALEAKNMPLRVRRSATLPFQYVNLGDKQSQLSDGGFSSNPPGNWATMKVFMGDGDQECEMYLNVNPVIHKAEFSIKDSDYGDLMLAELAKVL